jgi:hypothetical protein
VRGKLSGLKMLQGYSAYEVAMLNGFKGTEEEWLASLKGKGIEGIAEIGGGQLVDGDRVTSRWTDYRITFTDGKTMDYRVYGGADGKRGERGASITNIFLKEVTDEGNVYYIQVGQDIYPFTAPKGDKGDPGERGEPGKDGAMSFEELTDEQRESLRGEPGQPGEKGNPFTYEDFTPEQLEALRGEPGKDGTMRFEDLTAEQKESLRGEPGQPGNPGQDGEDGVGISNIQYTQASGNYASNTLRIYTTDGKNYSFSVKNGGQGNPGQDGIDGKDGADGAPATINGVNALTLATGTGLSGSQSGNTYTLSLASHDQAASTITAGTFAGQVVAKSDAQTPGTSLLRNSKIVSADTDPTVNGEINWTYA